MPFRFTAQDPDLEAAVRRVAWEQALRGADAADDGGRAIAERVHEVRRRTKKLRALIRLVRPRLRGARRENAGLREAARALAGVRDRRVLLETLDAVVRAMDEPVDVADVSALRARLSLEAREAEGAPAVAEAVDAAGAELRGLIARLPEWRVRGKEHKALRGLARTVERARERLDALDADDPESIHEWRKRVKDHRDHVRLLAPAYPGLRARAKSLRGLAERLGEHHDLTDLRGALASSGLDARTRARLDAHCEARCARILAASLPLGRQLFAEEPDALHARFVAYWRERPKDRVHG